MNFVVVDIGCIECGAPSHVVGIYKKRAAALEAGREYLHADHPEAAQNFRKHEAASYFNGAQHRLELFEIGA